MSKKKLTEEQIQKKKDTYEKEIVDVIINNVDICFIQEIFLCWAGCSSSTFYEYGLEKSEYIKAVLDKNRTVIKQEMRGNWKKKDAGPALQMGAYKLMGDDEERKKLSQTFIETTGPKGGPIQYSDMTTEEIDQRLKELRDKENEDV